jgi:hypothetical protein
MNPKNHPDNHQGSVPVSDNHPTPIKTRPNFSIEMQVNWVLSTSGFGFLKYFKELMILMKEPASNKQFMVGSLTSP